MGVVYLAHNRLMGRDEVLKVMGQHIMERPGVLDRFLARDPGGRQAPPSKYRHGLPRDPARRQHRLRDGVCRRTRPVTHGQGQRAAAGQPRLQFHLPGSARASSTPTRRGSSIVTSSRAT